MASNLPVTSLRTSIALTLAMIAIHESSAATKVGDPTRRTGSATTTSGALCSTPIQHPLLVQATALGSVERGVPLRIRVTTTAANGIDRGEVRLTSSGGASTAGAVRAELGAVPAGGHVVSDFTVTLPSSGHRFLLQFEARGEGGNRILTRGATLNLLPDGPAESSRTATAGSGERLLEVRAGRIGQ